ncbi:DUF559 domain-containing protein [Pseudonocardiaceae bacterium YIM PH 21723]|nr:DUF559 domain-containing protein [Pseudonocardiaceae bacterium YIM PH 21723]
MSQAADLDALQKTTSLMNFLAEVTDAAQRNPIRDIQSEETGTPELKIWLRELPEGIRLTPQARDDVLLRVQPPRLLPQPRLPQVLHDWVDLDRLTGYDGPEPELFDHDPGTEAQDQPPATIRREFDRWLAQWRSWSTEQHKTRERRRFYETLESAAKTMEQQDDRFEFVLAIGLICWQAPDGERIRRHLLTEPVVPKLDRVTAEITVTLAGGKRRFEDRELFEDQDLYQPDSGRVIKQSMLTSDSGLLDSEMISEIERWLGVAFTESVERADVRVIGDRLPSRPQLSASPALLLRPRSQALLAETYRRISASLTEEGAQVPVALAQLVVDTEVTVRERWLSEQGATSSDVLGADPLFPLPANDEQMRVLDLLRDETSVVVQGPPGTGKTHTIANLVSALLARGLRVLVTSQKDQALRVLREKIPADMRRLCVLLAGGSKDAAKELEQSLDALSEAVTTSSPEELTKKLGTLATQRTKLKSRSAALNDQIRRLRDAENISHPPVVPGYNEQAYRGTLTQIVREVKLKAKACEWIPTVDLGQPDRPPLSTAELVELRRLLRSDTPQRRIRGGQRFPDSDELPDPAELTEIIYAERDAQRTAHEDTSQLTQRVATLDIAHLREMADWGQAVRADLLRLGFTEEGTPGVGQTWVVRAVNDGFSGRHAGIWGHLREVRSEAERLQTNLQAQGVRFVIEMPPMNAMGIGRARGLLNAGRALKKYLAEGGKLRTYLPKSPAQKNAEELLSLVKVDGQPPTALPQLGATLDRLEAEVAAAQLALKWADAGVPVSTERLTATLSELDDNDRQLEIVERLSAVHHAVQNRFLQGGVSTDLGTPQRFLRALGAIPAALRYVELERARTQVTTLLARVQQVAAVPGSCPELSKLVDAVRDRDSDAYRRGLTLIEVARTEHDDEHRRAQLHRTLKEAHPELCELLELTVEETAWDEWLRDLPAAWAWSKAEQFVQLHRTADEERLLLAEYDQVEYQIDRTTKQLAATQALRACLLRMSDKHARALRSYREHMNKVGAGSGLKAGEFRRAAKAAMEKAKDAVPAWVVPLPNLLDNIAAERNSFDVVIVDEASQVGVEQLFLLWMAPRVIVVGDDQQCTPGPSRMGKLEPLFARLHDHLRDVDQEIRQHFTSKSHLYGMLSARSGKNAVTRLREHFRCMPEIITWSSTQFYGEEGRPGLVPLRERTSDDLEPLKVVYVEGGFIEGRDTKRRNPIEAKRLVAQLSECLSDPRYAGKSFGVVVLQGHGQVKLLELEINAAITPEQRAERKIRVGSPAEFQGDERDVIFLSMLVAEPPNAQYATSARQSFNVAASRAKDQMWLFSSVRLDQLKPQDLRSSLMAYMMNPPSVFGASPDLDQVSDTSRCEPFDSLFEQLVYRAIKKRGYHVVPQHPVGSRKLDLVVVGDGGRVAIECDGHQWHTSPEQQTSDARRDLELRRMRWDVLRIRESEFEFDPERELAPLWQHLAERNIHPHFNADVASTWSPIDLSHSADDELSGAVQ